MTSKYRNTSLMILVTFLLCIPISTCDNILPDAYQEEDYKISSMGENACELLSVGDTLLVSVEAIVIESYVDTSMWDEENIGNSIGALFDSLGKLMDTLEVNRTANITNPDEQEQCYAFFNSPKTGAYYFFQTWDLTDLNIDERIEIDLYDSNGALVTEKDSSIPFETISGCIAEMEFVSSGERETVPKIRGQYKFNLEQGPYIIQFVLSDPNRIESFRVAIIQ